MVLHRRFGHAYSIRALMRESLSGWSNVPMQRPAKPIELAPIRIFRPSGEFSYAYWTM